MNANDMYPSKYLKASDIGEHKPVVTISRIEVEKLGNEEDADTKPIIYFQGKDKGLVCNKTNWNTIIKLYGQETDGWIGKPIRLQAMEVQFKDQMTLAIRVSLQKPTATTPAAKLVKEEEGGEIPF